MPNRRQHSFRSPVLRENPKVLLQRRKSRSLDLINEYEDFCRRRSSSNSDEAFHSAKSSPNRLSPEKLKPYERPKTIQKSATLVDRYCNPPTKPPPRPPAPKFQKSATLKERPVSFVEKRKKSESRSGTFSFMNSDEIAKILRMKKIFRKSKTTLEQPEEDRTNTLDRIVNEKDQVRKKWLKEQEEFAKRRQAHQLQMIEMEEAEILRREDEIKRKNEELENKKRLNKMIRAKVEEQIQILQQKLDEYAIDHAKVENDAEDVIIELEDKLIDVKNSLEKRRAELGDSPTAPPSYDDQGNNRQSTEGAYGGGQPPAYPDLDEVDGRDSSQIGYNLHIEKSTGNTKGDSLDSLSLSNSSRSLTPKSG